MKYVINNIYNNYMYTYLKSIIFLSLQFQILQFEIELQQSYNNDI